MVDLKNLGGKREPQKKKKNSSFFYHFKIFLEKKNSAVFREKKGEKSFFLGPLPIFLFFLT